MERGVERSAEFRAEVRERVRRLARLRASWRALASSVWSNAELEALSRSLRDRLGSVAKRCDAPSAAESAETRAELSAIDGLLAEYAERLREATEQIQLAQLRATLPSVVRQSRDEVLALADLLVEDQESLPRRLGILEYLLTLLSFEEVSGRRRIVHDPVLLTPHIHALCMRLEAQSQRDFSEVELKLYASASLESECGDIEQLIREMRAHKLELGLDLLIPGVLRAAVTYNASMWNYVEAQIEQERLADPGPPLDEELFDAESSPDDDIAWREIAGPPHVALETGSVFESKAIERIAASLGRRFRGAQLEDTLSDRIALRVDLSEFEESERCAVVSLTECGSSEVLGTAIVVGLAIRLLPVASDELRELGIDGERLRQDWIQDVDRALRDLTNAKIAEQCYDEACALAQTKTKFLYAPVSSLYREAREAKDPLDRGAPRIAPEAGLEPPRAEPQPPEREQTSQDASRAQRTLSGGRAKFRMAVGVTATALMSFALLNFLRPAPTTVLHFSTEQLRAVSQLLKSGYRDHHGVGPLFVGRLVDGWKSLDAKARREEGEKIATGLSEAGVREVMIYDDLLRLEIHFASGELKTPAVSEHPPPQSP